MSPIPVIVGSGEKRPPAIAARLGDGCKSPSDTSTLDRKLAIFRRHCLQAGHDPAQAEVAVLDIPVIGRDVRSRIDRGETARQDSGRTTAAAFVRRYHTDTAEDHFGLAGCWRNVA